MDRLLGDFQSGASSELLDAGAAGTTFRFLTAYLAMQSGSQVLTGTERMKQRPIGILVDALRRLGARIDYLEKEGYPPLRVHTPNAVASSVLRIKANTSSQYISALLMLGPTLPAGLSLHLEGKIVSRPYIEMTLGMMGYFGVRHEWQGNIIHIAPQVYQARPFTVEADWSAASYYYAMAALSSSCELRLKGLFEESLQGDAVLKSMMTHFGVQTQFQGDELLLTKVQPSQAGAFQWDFIKCPDLAQTLAVVCGGTGIGGTFTGLETLRIKETDRIDALQRELAKVKVAFNPCPNRSAGEECHRVEGRSQVADQPDFDTYEDHRMAMAFAPLALQQPIRVNEPEVVVKSYPDFWKDLESLGFIVDRTVDAS